MTIPRSGHCILYANGKLTAFGGHTTNFVPTQTAEYLNGGEWHTMPMAYTHDNGFAVVLRSGEVILGGGHEKTLGIGQTFMMERYDARQHSFEGFGCLDCQRTLANATQLADGRVIISGNHYAPDAIACYNGRSQVEHLVAPRQERSNPYILPIADDNALILSGSNLHMQHPDTIWVDRLRGNAFRVPLLDEWKPVFTDQPFSSEACRTCDHTYLLTATDSTGQLGFVVVSDTTFSLLPTTLPVPMNGPHGPIAYKGPAVVDRKHKRGFVIGVDSLCRHQYVLCVDYTMQPAELALYYTDSLEHATVTIPVLSPDGDLILAGGNPEDNYKPLAAVWCYHFATDGPTVAATHTWLWLVLVAALLIVLTYIIKRYISKRRKGQDTKQPDNQLISRICQLLETDRRYLTSPLRVSDVAIELGVSVADVNESISRERSLTFAQLIAEYRVRHAQQLLSEQPDIKLAVVISESGFTSDTTFFRTFKAVTGLSPREWLARKKNEQDNQRLV